MTTRFLAAILATLACFAAHAQQEGMRVQVFAVESLEDFERWAQQQPAPRGEYPRNLRQLPAGRPVHFPIVVSGLQPRPAAVDLVADIEFIAPNGASIGKLERCCGYAAPAGSDARMVVLGNAATLVFAPSDMTGIYGARVTVRDGPRSAESAQQFRFDGPPGAKPAASAAPEAAPAAAPRAAAPAPAPAPAARAPAKAPAPPPPAAPSSAAEAPKLRMTLPAKNPGRDVDKRDCLSLPTPAEIIKCAERK